MRALILLTVLGLWCGGAWAEVPSTRAERAILGEALPNYDALAQDLNIRNGQFTGTLYLLEVNQE